MLQALTCHLCYAANQLLESLYVVLLTVFVKATFWPNETIKNWFVCYSTHIQRMLRVKLQAATVQSSF